MTHRRDTRLADAVAATALQRERLKLRIAATRERLLPARLTSDATTAAEQIVTNTARQATDQVRRHPVASGAALAALLAWTFRDPLLRHGPDGLARAYGWLAGHLPFSDADAHDAGNNDAEPSVQDITDADDDQDEQEHLPNG
jgi:hypothetical protein